MIDELKATDILSALGFVVLESHGARLVRLASPAPEWFRRLFPEELDEGQSLPLAEALPFLENFLIDAEWFWNSDNAGRLRSGPWTETDSQGRECALAASAIRVGGKRYLLVEALGEQFAERRAALQLARNKGLETERLDQRVTELAREKKQLLGRTREIERVNRLKSEFVASMSHELRTPLNSILGFASLLAEERSGALNERQQKYLGHLTQASHHLLDLINDFLDLSKIEAGHQELRWERFPLGEALEEVLAAVRPTAFSRGIVLERSTKGRPYVFADRTRFKQILYNLLSNGIKFTPAGGRVHVGSWGHGQDVRIEVRDTGIGIPPEEREAVFRKFYQSSKGQRDTREGSGLGLAITKKLVELHGGKIWVETPPEGGSAFIFTVPSAPGGPQLPETGLDTAPNRSPAPTRIAVVEDDEAGGALLAAMLEDRYEVDVYGTGEAALEGFEQRRPNLVLLDISLPGMDGIELLRAMRVSQPLTSVPAVAISAHALASDQQRFRDAGFDACFSKPITDSSTLRKVIESLCDAQQ